MKKLNAILFILLSVLISCSRIHSKNYNNSINSQRDYQTFNSFLGNFMEKKLPLEVDSITVTKFHIINNFKKVDENDLRLFLPIPEIFDMQGVKPSYVFFYLYKVIIPDQRIGLIYMYNLNPEVPFDDYLYKIILAIYTKEGKFLYYKEIASYQLYFNSYKIITCIINNKLEIIKTTIFMIEDDNGNPKIQITNTHEEIK